MQNTQLTLKRLLGRLLCSGAAVAVSLSVASCESHNHAEHDHDHDHGSETEVHDHEHIKGEDKHSEDKHSEDKHAEGIHMEPEDAERYGVSIVEIQPGDFREAVKAAAEVLPSSSDVATASASTSGMVNLAAGITQGSVVKAGQVIARIKSTGVSGGDVNAAGKIAVENAKRELDRVTPLLKEGLITKKEYNDALAAYNAALAAYSPSAASGAVVAPKSGVITGITAGEGAFVNTGDPVAVISGSGRLTLRALLPVRHASLLPLLSGVVITPHGSEGSPVDLSQYGGKLLSSTSASSTETPGYIPVYYTFENSAPVVAGSAAEVFLQGSNRQGVISVPVEAMSEQLGEKFVYVKTGGHEYEKRHVKTGASNGTNVEILSGLKPGENVVVGGVSFVRLAEQSTAVPEGHSHNH